MEEGFLLLNQNGWFCKFVFVMLQLVETGLLIGLSVALLQVRLHVQFALDGAGLDKRLLHTLPQLWFASGNFEWSFHYYLF